MNDEQSTIGFDELLEILTNHKIHLKMKQSALLHQMTSPAMFDGAVKTSHFKRLGRRGSITGGRSGGRTAPQPRQDLCPVFG